LTGDGWTGVGAFTGEMAFTSSSAVTCSFCTAVGSITGSFSESYPLGISAGSVPKMSNMLLGMIRAARPPPRFEVAPLTVVFLFDADFASVLAFCFVFVSDF
jgi:ABC-type nitrate/sulfonate/bicarbonate transport system permease component